jgi:hypothetical protein
MPQDPGRCGGAAALVAVPRAGAEPQKVSKAEAKYQDRPRGIYNCELCAVFEKPNACRLVEGEISPDGWCEIFHIAD